MTCISWSSVLSYISKTVWMMSVIFSDNDTVWPKLWPQSKYSSYWPVFHGLVILLNIFKIILMDEHHSWYNVSVWHKDWPHQVCVGQWPIFYGPVSLKTIWWRNVVFGIMDQCDSNIDLIKYTCMWVSDLYFILPCIIVIDLNYFYTLRNGAGQGYSCPSGHLLYFFFIKCKCKFAFEVDKFSWPALLFSWFCLVAVLDCTFKEWILFFWCLSKYKLHWVACKVSEPQRSSCKLCYWPNVVYNSINIRTDNFISYFYILFFS